MTATRAQTAGLLAQHGHDVRLDWGRSGLAALGDGAIVSRAVELGVSDRVPLLDSVAGVFTDAGAFTGA